MILTNDGDKGEYVLEESLVVEVYHLIKEHFGSVDVFLDGDCLFSWLLGLAHVLVKIY